MGLYCDQRHVSRNFLLLSMRLSIVRKTSKLPETFSRSSPLLRPAQPVCCTVLTSWPTNSSASSRGKHSSMRVRNRFQSLAGDLHCCYCLVTCNRWERIEKVIQAVTSLQAVDEVLNRHTRPDKNRRSTEDSRIAMDDLGFFRH